MSFADAIAESGAKPGGKRPFFLNEDVETVLGVTMAVAQELAVARQRIDTLERLLEAKGVVGREEIETFAPNTSVAIERAHWSQEYIARILRIVQQRNEAAAVANDIASEDVGDELGRPDA